MIRPAVPFSNFFKPVRCGAFLCIALFGSVNIAAAVEINKPVGQTESGCFGLRLNHPVRGGPAPHKGTDYAAPQGTPPVISPGYIGEPNYLPFNGSAGNTLDVNYPNGVRVRYFHLQSYEAGPPPKPKTGNTGGPYPFHLHYEVHIDGQPVDPEAAFGLDLDDPTIRSCLKKDGAQRLAGAIARCDAREVCGVGGSPYDGPPPIIPGYDSGDVPLDDGGVAGRPGITPQTYPAATHAGGPESGLGPGLTGPVLWDSSEYMVSGLTTNACDVNIFAQLRGRAAMEAQEDVVATEMALHRPDSVMEYVCFDEFLGYSAERLDSIFSGNQFWANGTVKHSNGIGGAMSIASALDEVSLDEALQNSVLAGLSAYINNQFPATLLGGGAVADLDAPEISNVIGGAGYTCKKMINIWEAAKCENFADSRIFTAPGAPFYTFDEMIPATQDPRVQYAACGNTGLSPIDLEVMTNKDFLYNGIQSALPLMQKLDAMIDPYSCTGQVPLATGMTVVQSKDFGEATEEIITYPEHLCTNPRCYYDYVNKTCTK